MDTINLILLLLCSYSSIYYIYSYIELTLNNKIKIEIRTNDHLPPHFHVLIDEQEAAFTIMECTQLNGNIENKYLKSIKKWYKKNRKVLICQWNLTRPSDKEYTKIKQ